MKKVEAIIRPSKLKAVQRGLKEAEIPCITVVPVKGTGLQTSYSERYRGTEQSMILHSRVMIICVISDNHLEKCIDVIKKNASENKVGDGKIFIYNVEDAIRLSTGVQGNDAII
ncbi:P-II family nitrogen regulator [Flavivirga aquimarina]|uniref:P-II family nitrogen regulator n=1 Tax=Flavivirga aquimarina TaxID=2027862 RepID=A0ABT8WAK2_9FLAO|nr:P-II family nitrogen regulator [Flavivirga aquimarina]MDO5970145.1 P-II family nitrogen regulator [Flavivirga aquimarina]